MSIYTKLLEVQKQNLSIQPDAENPYYHSKYATLENIHNVVSPELSKLNVLWYDSIQTDVVVTHLVDTDDGTEVVSSFPIDKTLNAQQRGAEVSYARRYNISGLLTLVTDTDDDGNSAISAPAWAPKQYPTTAPQTYSKYNREPTKWLSESDIIRMFDDIRAWTGKKYGSSDEMVKDLRNSWLGVSKKLADYISQQFIKAFQEMPF